MSKRIRVTEATHAALEQLKGEEETYDDLLQRLVEERASAIRAGAGLWEGSDAAARARENRRELKRDIGPR